MTSSGLEESWAALDLLEGGRATLRARMVDGRSVGGRPVFVASDWEGLRHLLLPTAGDVEVALDDRSRGIRISKRELLDGNRLERFVDIACLKPSLNHLFDVVAGEMLQASSSVTLTGVPAACRAVLERWRDLIEEASGDRVSKEVLLGAWGELWFVREGLRLGVPLDGLWTGPLGAVHDLKGRNGVEVEVKTSAGRGPLLVEIHGLEQLEAPVGGKLYLGVLRVRSNDLVGESLGDLVRACDELGGSPATLQTSLAAIGIALGQRDVEQSKFEVQELRFYDVGLDFPRIVHASFLGGHPPAGTASVRYTLDLTGEPPTPLDVAEFGVVIASMGNP